MMDQNNNSASCAEVGSNNTTRDDNHHHFDVNNNGNGNGNGGDSRIPTVDCYDIPTNNTNTNYFEMEDNNNETTTMDHPSSSSALLCKCDYIGPVTALQFVSYQKRFCETNNNDDDDDINNNNNNRVMTVLWAARGSWLYSYPITSSSSSSSSSHSSPQSSSSSLRMNEIGFKKCIFVNGGIIHGIVPYYDYHNNNTKTDCTIVAHNDDDDDDDDDDKSKMMTMMAIYGERQWTIILEPQQHPSSSSSWNHNKNNNNNQHHHDEDAKEEELFQSSSSSSSSMEIITMSDWIHDMKWIHTTPTTTTNTPHSTNDCPTTSNDTTTTNNDVTTSTDNYYLLAVLCAHGTFYLYQILLPSISSTIIVENKNDNVHHHHPPPNNNNKIMVHCIQTESCPIVHGIAFCMDLRLTTTTTTTTTADDDDGAKEYEFQIAMGTPDKYIHIWNIPFTTTTTTTTTTTNDTKNDIPINDDDTNNNNEIVENENTIICKNTSGTVKSWKAHEGAIFQVKWNNTNNNMSSTITTNNTTNNNNSNHNDCNNLLVSCSEDRTIQVWRKNNNNHNNCYNDDDDDKSSSQYNNYYYECICTLFGHTARIWDCQILSSSTNNRISLASCGEDSTLRFWSLSPSSDDNDRIVYNGIETSSIRIGNTIQSIWTMATTTATNTNSSNLLAVGNNNGTVHIIDTYHHQIINDTTTPTIATSLQPPNNNNPNTTTTTTPASTNNKKDEKNDDGRHSNNKKTKIKNMDNDHHHHPFQCFILPTSKKEEINKKKNDPLPSCSIQKKEENDNDEKLNHPKKDNEENDKDNYELFSGSEKTTTTTTTTTGKKTKKKKKRSSKINSSIICGMSFYQKSYSKLCIVTRMGSYFTLVLNDDDDDVQTITTTDTNDTHNINAKPKKCISSSSIESTTSGYWISHGDWVHSHTEILPTPTPPSIDYSPSTTTTTTATTNTTTESNTYGKVTTTDNQSSSSSPIPSQKIMNNGNCLSIHPNENVVAIGTSCGHIVLADLKKNNNNDDHHEQQNDTNNNNNKNINNSSMISSPFKPVQSLQWWQKSENKVNDEASCYYLISFHIKGKVSFYIYNDDHHDTITSTQKNNINHTKYNCSNTRQPKLLLCFILDMTTMGIPMSWNTSCLYDSDNDHDNDNNGSKNGERLMWLGDSRGNIAMFLLNEPLLQLSSIKDIGKVTNSNSIAEHSVQEFSPIQIIKAAHKKEHVTSILVSTTPQPSTLVIGRNNTIMTIWSSGNDGFINEYKLQKNNVKLDNDWKGRVIMHRALYIPVPNMTGIRMLYHQNRKTTSALHRNHEQLLVGGYRGNQFVVWDQEKQHPWLSVDTGGRQRRQDVFLSTSQTALTNQSTTSTNSTFGIAIITGPNEISIYKSLLLNSFDNHINSDVMQTQNIMQSPSNSSSLIKYCGVSCHGETLFDLCWCDTSQPDTKLLVSGSNDCTVQLSIYSNDSSENKYQLNHVLSLPPHESCIRAVASSRHPITSTDPTDNNNKTTLVVVAGGKLHISFYLLVEEEGGNECTKMQLSTFLLCRNKTPYSKSNNKGNSIDHRINAIQAIPIIAKSDSGDLNKSGDKWHLVLAGDSNGSLHLTILSEELGQKYHIEAKILPGVGGVNARPILSIDLLRLSDEWIIACIGDTSGQVSIWILPGILTGTHSSDYVYPSTPAYVYSAHEMGTNSVTMTLMNDSTKTRIENYDNCRSAHNKNCTMDKEFILCSGGDDQAITVAWMKFKPPCLAESESSSTESGLLTTISVQTIQGASSSALKGVKIMCDLDILGRFRLYAVGYDQRLALWQINASAQDGRETLTIQYVYSVAVDVFDTNCMDCCTTLSRTEHGSTDTIDGHKKYQELLAVGGEGIELISFDPKKIHPRLKLN